MNRIYALCDPRPAHLECYIGITSQPKRRFQDHLLDGMGNPHEEHLWLSSRLSAKYAWLASLRQAGIQPVMVILQEHATGHDEMTWMRFVETHRHMLLTNNIADRNACLEVPSLDEIRHQAAIKRLAALYSTQHERILVGQYLKVVAPSSRHAEKLPYTYYTSAPVGSWFPGFQDTYRCLYEFLVEGRYEDLSPHLGNPKTPRPGPFFRISLAMTTLAT